MSPRLRILVSGIVALLGCDLPTPPPRTGGIVLSVDIAASSAGSLNGGRVRLTGPTPITVNVTPGQQVSIVNLTPGSYTIALEGLINNEVANFVQFAVTVTAGPPAQVNVPGFPSFIPTITSLPPNGNSTTFTVSYSPVASADSYRVEAATDQQFTNIVRSQSVPKTVTSPSVTVTSFGTYVIRVRGIDHYGVAGSPSVGQSILLAPPPSISLSPAVLTFQPTGPGTIGQPATVNNGPNNGGSGSVDGLGVAPIHYLPGQGTGWLAASLVGTSAPTQLNVNATAGSIAVGTDTAYVVLTSTTPGVQAESLLAVLVVNSTADHLVFSSQPTTTVAGKPIASFQVTAQDASNATLPNFTDSITVHLTAGTGKAGAVLLGDTTVMPVSGVATFTGLSIDSAASAYTLDASAQIAPGNTIQSRPPSAPFNITPDVAAQLAFTTQPSGGQANTTLAPVQVTAYDQFHNVATGFVANVNLAITGGTPGAVLTGGSVAATSGVATFSNLSINLAGNGYMLAATSSGLAGSTSNAFNILSGAVSATNSTVNANPTSIAINSGTSTITVTAKDGGGNPIQGATVFLTATGTGNNLTQPATVTNAQGAATGTLSSSVAETKTVTATVSSVTITQQATVTVTSASCSNCWATKAPMPTARTGLGVGAINGKLYAVGGYNGAYLDTLEVYDTANNTWSTLKSMPTARRRLAAGVINGKLYAVGGYNGSYLATLEAYDPSSNTWTSLKPMTVPRHRLAVAVANGKLYAIGGENTTGSLNTVEQYDPVSNNWTMVDTISPARFGLGVDSTNNGLYAVGGYNGTYPKPIQRYDFTNPWNTLSATFQMTSGRSGMGVGVINGLLYVVGGYNGSFLTTVEALDPSTGWTSRQPLSAPRAGLAAAVINGKLYAVGGDTGGAAFATLEVYTP